MEVEAEVSSWTLPVHRAQIKLDRATEEVAQIGIPLVLASSFWRSSR